MIYWNILIGMDFIMSDIEHLLKDSLNFVFCVMSVNVLCQFLLLSSSFSSQFLGGWDILGTSGHCQIFCSVCI